MFPLAKHVTMPFASIVSFGAHSVLATPKNICSERKSWGNWAARFATPNRHSKNVQMTFNLIITQE